MRIHQSSKPRIVIVNKITNSDLCHGIMLTNVIESPQAFRHTLNSYLWTKGSMSNGLKRGDAGELGVL